MSSILNVIVDDRIVVSGETTVDFSADNTSINAFDTLISALPMTNVHSIWWDGSTGEIESKSMTVPNLTIEESVITPFRTACTTEVNRQIQLEKQAWLAKDASEIARGYREYLLQETDAWALSDRTMTSAQTAYRQALRDLPDHATDWNPVMTWDDSTQEGSYSGVTWPTKP